MSSGSVGYAGESGAARVVGRWPGTLPGSSRCQELRDIGSTPLTTDCSHFAVSFRGSCNRLFSSALSCFSFAAIRLLIVFRIMVK